MKEKIKNFCDKMTVAAPVASVVAMGSTAVNAFADGTAPSAYIISSSDLTQISTAVTSSIQAALPIGVAVMATMIGLGVVCRVIYKFI